jgi:hypothetical protein
LGWAAVVLPAPHRHDDADYDGYQSGNGYQLISLHEIQVSCCAAAREERARLVRLVY